MDSTVDPIEPYAALNSSERVNPTSRSKADKDQKEFVRELKKRLSNSEQDEPQDSLELSDDVKSDNQESESSDRQSKDDESEESEKQEKPVRHVDLKA